MPLEETIIVGQDGTAPPGTGLPLRVAVVPSALGPALVTNASFTGTLEVNLDLANDEVAIGGPQAGNVGRQLFRGTDNGDGTSTLETAATSVVPGTGASNLGKAEDAPHTTGDVGVQALAVRNDIPGALAGTDGDYAPLQVDSAGRLAAVAVPGPLLSTSTSVPTAVAAVSVLLLAAAANRRTLLIRNSGAGPLYVAPRTPAVTTDILIASGETREINGLLAQSAWYAISNGVGATATTYAGLVAT